MLLEVAWSYFLERKLVLLTYGQASLSLSTSLLLIALRQLLEYANCHPTITPIRYWSHTSWAEFTHLVQDKLATLKISQLHPGREAFGTLPAMGKKHKCPCMVLTIWL